MKKLITIKGQITLLLSSFFLLVIISVGVMFWVVRTQESDALIINLAGRQRMLSQKLTWLSLNDPDNYEIQESLEIFEQTLHSLRFGGQAIETSGNIVILPPAPDIEIQSQLDEVSQTWNEFKQYLKYSDSANLLIESPQILKQIDIVVSSFEARAEAKNQRLKVIQASFLIAAILLLTWGFILTRQKIIKPLSVLNVAVDKMTEGNLKWNLPEMEKDELGDLAEAFETMRTELASSRTILETTVAQRTHELVSAFEFSQEIVAEREQTELINSVVDRARFLVGAQEAALCIINYDANELELVASSGSGSIPNGARNAVNTELTLAVIGNGKTVREKTGCVECLFLEKNPDGQCIVTPLRSMDRTIGALCVIKTEKTQDNQILPFDMDSQRALALLANSAAVSITNTQLAKLENQKIEQEAALAEREQLAANLHDELAQTLSFTRLKLEQLKEELAETPIPEDRLNIDPIIEAIDSAYQQVRNALTGLLMPSSSEDDFFKKLSACVADFNQNCDCYAELKIINPSALEFPKEIQVQILHVIREALSNIQRHAQASRVVLHIEKVEGHAQYYIEDDGKGFDRSIPMGNNHFGLKIMQTRVERSGGFFEIITTPSNGTKVIMSFPLEMREKVMGRLQ